MAENEHSSKRSDNKRELEDHDGTSSPKEHFKKARFSWQIKGQGSSVTGTNVISKPVVAAKSTDGMVETLPGELTSVNDRNCRVVESLVKCSATEMHSESDDDSQTNLDNKTDKLVRTSSSETKTKFEMLREVGSGYSERIEEFLKTQANRFESDRDSDESTCEDEPQTVSMLHKSDLESRSIEAIGGHHSEDTNRGRLTFDSPQLNHNLFNITSWLWQKQELGCAIVDNVFNRTLEELGLSPDPEANLQATTRVSVENQSIEAAINQQGLAVGIEPNEDTFDSFTSSEEAETGTLEKLKSVGMDSAVHKCSPNNKLHNFNNDRTLSGEMGNKHLETDNIESNTTNPNIRRFAKVNKQRPKSKPFQEIHLLSSEDKCEPKSPLSNFGGSPQSELGSSCCNSDFDEPVTEKRSEKCKPSSVHGVVNTAETAEDSMDLDETFTIDRKEVESDPDLNRVPVNILDIAVSTTIMSKGLNIR